LYSKPGRETIVDILRELKNHFRKYFGLKNSNILAEGYKKIEKITQLTTFYFCEAKISSIHSSKFVSSFFAILKNKLNDRK